MDFCCRRQPLSMSWQTMKPGFPWHKNTTSIHRISRAFRKSILEKVVIPKIDIFNRYLYVKLIPRYFYVLFRIQHGKIVQETCFWYTSWSIVARCASKTDFFARRISGKKSIIQRLVISYLANIIYAPVTTCRPILNRIHFFAWPGRGVGEHGVILQKREERRYIQEE